MIDRLGNAASAKTTEGEAPMAKGQQRSTREKKKPKQEKVKPAAATPRFAASPVVMDTPQSGKK